MFTMVLAMVQAAGSFSMADPGWAKEGAVQVLEEQGRQAMRIGTGRALRRDIALADGTIDVDVWLTGLRSFVYVQFRMAGDRDHEEFYLRPHKSNLPDAVQYAPVYRGESAWQLYHGPGGTAEVPLPVGRWVAVRVAVSADRAALFVGDTVTPVVVVPRLAAGHRRGYLALRGFVPAGSAAPYAALFSNFRVTHRTVTITAPPADTAPPGVVTEWEVSQPFRAEPGAVVTQSEAAGRGPWHPVATEPNGMLSLSRVVVRPKPERTTVLTRFRVEAARAGWYRMRLGFSDEVTVFVAGRPLFAANAAYSYDRPRQEGLITLDQATAFLPLTAGSNEVVIAVTDVFGGWGVWAALDPTDGLAVRAP
ncbi:MAG: hypothetical protein ACKVZ0_02880 [Gemmatimonadales bacterium]